MFSKRELEGYLMIDHRNSPGISPEEAALAGRDTLPVGRGRIAEFPAINCSHCQRLVVMNPGRIRDRAYCGKCDRYICDHCEAERVRTGVCKPFKQVIDEFIDDAAHGRLISDRTKSGSNRTA